MSEPEFLSALPDLAVMPPELPWLAEEYKLISPAAWSVCSVPPAAIATEPPLPYTESPAAIKTEPPSPCSAAASSPSPFPAARRTSPPRPPPLPPSFSRPEPALILTEPARPFECSVSPAASSRWPPLTISAACAPSTLVSERPTARLMLPADPPIALPVPITTEPLSSPTAVPVSARIAPVGPAGAFPVSRLM